MSETPSESAPSTDPRVLRTHRAVLDAAERLLFEGGPAAVTYSALAEASGVGRATIYRHWPTMGDLWNEIAVSAAQRMTIELDGDVRTNLRRALSLVAQRILSERDRMNFLTMLERIQYDEETRRFAEMFRSRTPVHHALAKGIEDGELPSDLDTSVAASLLLGPMMHRGLMAREPIDDAFIDTIVDRFLQAP